MIKSLLVSAFCGMVMGQMYAQHYELTSTTVSEPWKTEKVRFDIKNNSNLKVYNLEISEEDKDQQMIGFGGCFNELGWEALKLISTDERNDLLMTLFDPDEANFCYNRFPIGASDYSSGFYSFNEVDGDFEMKNFSIARDRNCLIPYIKMAQAINPDMTFFASPWCPPSWMKTNNHYASISSAQYNNLPTYNQSVTNTTGFKMLRGYLDSYALYFSKFLDAYEKEGIKVTDLHVQNEVIAEQIFPSCIWTPEDLSLFISDYLGPRFENEGRNVNIWLGTLNVGDPDYVTRAFNNKKVLKYIKGIGFQWDGKKAISTIHKKYPDMQLIQTENECGGGENNWSSALHMWNLMKIYINAGARAYIYWNFVLQNPGVSYWGWKQNSMVTIDVQTKKVTYNPEFYLMKHFSHYIKKGAYKLSLSGYEDALAFSNPDGTYIVVVANRSNSDEFLNIKLKDKNLKVCLKANSFNTIKF